MPPIAARPAGVPLAARLVAAAAALREPDAAVLAKVQTCLLDLIGCALEARERPWSRQAVGIAAPMTPGATVIGHAGPVSWPDAAFANAVMGHGLVREDMHAASVSHLGVVVLPVALALAERQRTPGRDFVCAVVAGYEAGARIGRALMDPQRTRIVRPTGVTGPLAGAVAGARLLGLSSAQAASAVALAANTTAGFNEWAHTGGSEMFFHPGFAARNAVNAVQLAALGAFASPSALDGQAGLFAAFGKLDACAGIEPFQGQPEILSVYHKAVPACNFAQTPAQAAAALARTMPLPIEHIAAIRVRVPHAAAHYPGCDYNGPFAHPLQAKMSIQYNVASALILGGTSERNFELLDDARLHRLIGLMTLEVDDAMSRRFPAEQGAQVQVRDSDGSIHQAGLDDVVHASVEEVTARFRAAADGVLGRARTQEIEAFIANLRDEADVGRLAALLRAPQPHP